MRFKVGIEVRVHMHVGWSEHQPYAEMATTRGTVRKESKKETDTSADIYTSPIFD
jgi:hypothetical protein